MVTKFLIYLSDDKIFFYSIKWFLDFSFLQYIYLLRQSIIYRIYAFISTDGTSKEELLNEHFFCKNFIQLVADVALIRVIFITRLKASFIKSMG